MTKTEELNKTRILLVEDDQAIRELIVEALSESGYDVESAVDAVDAVDPVRKVTPDAVLMDLNLPELKGETLADMLRVRYGKNLPLILISGAPDIQARAAHARADAFIAKPFEIEDLEATIERVIIKRVDNDSNTPTRAQDVVATEDAQAIDDASAPAKPLAPAAPVKAKTGKARAKAASTPVVESAAPKLGI